jgi:predicted MFS family arabinose efflux permease
VTPRWAARRGTSGTSGLGAPFWTLWSLYLASRATTFVIPFLGVYLVTERHLGVGTTGVALGLVGAGGIVANLVGGRSVDTQGGRFTFAAGMLSTAAAIVVLRCAASVLTILVAVTLLGFAAELFRPAAASMVADLVGPARRTWAFGILFWAVNLGYGISAAVGGVLAQSSFDVLFAVDCAACTIVGCLGLRYLPRPAGERQAERDEDAAHPVRNRPFLRYLLCWMLYGLVFAQLSTTFPVAMKLSHVTNQVVGLVLAINSLGIVALQPLALRVVPALDPLRVMVAGVLVTGCGAGTLVLAHGAALFACAMAVWTVGEILVSSVNQSLISDFAGDRPGAYFGAYGVAWGIAFTAGPLIGSQLLRGSGSLLWTACGVTSGLSAVGLAGMTRVMITGLSGPGPR